MCKIPARCCVVGTLFSLLQSGSCVPSLEAGGSSDSWTGCIAVGAIQWIMCKINNIDSV